MLKLNKIEPFLVTSQAQHLLWSNMQCQYGLTILVVSTVNAQLSLLDRLTPLPVTTQNGPLFIQTNIIN